MSQPAKLLPRSSSRTPDRIELGEVLIMLLQPRDGRDAARTVRRQVQEQRQKFVSASPVR
jgi:hypothetical protein